MKIQSINSTLTDKAYILLFLLLLSDLIFSIGMKLSFFVEKAYTIRIFDCLCAILIYNVFSNLLKGKLTNIQKKLLRIFFLFFVYYIILELFRMWGGGKVRPSISTFKLLVFSSMVCIYCLELNRKRIMWIMLTTISVINIVKLTDLAVTNYIGCVTYIGSYIVLGVMFYPFLCHIFQNIDTCTMEMNVIKIISTVNIIVLASLLFFSGSRSGTWIFIVESIICFFYCRDESKKIFRKLMICIVVLLSILYVFNVYMCHDSLQRVFFGGTYIIDISKDKQEPLMRNIDSIDFIQKKSILFHDPVEISNLERGFFINQALKRLKGDWLFSLKGDPIIYYKVPKSKKYVTGIAESGSHNGLIDYAMCFGVVGVIIIFYFPASLIYKSFTAYLNVKSKNLIDILSYLLIIGAMFSIGMVQANFSDPLAMSVFYVFLAYFYLYFEKGV